MDVFDLNSNSLRDLFCFDQLIETFVLKIEESLLQLPGCFSGFISIITAHFLLDKSLKAVQKVDSETGEAGL